MMRHIETFNNKTIEYRVYYRDVWVPLSLLSKELKPYYAGLEKPYNALWPPKVMPKKYRKPVLVK